MRTLLLILLAFPALAATNRTVTVKPSGGDYTSLAAAIAGEKGDMVSLDRQLTIECYAMADAGGAALFANADWVTDATRYVLVTVPTSERHGGGWNTSKYYLPVEGIALRVHSTEFVRIDGVQIYSTGDNSTFYVGGPDSGAGDIRISNSIIRGSSSSGYRGVFNASYVGGSSMVVRAWNNLVYGASSSGIGRGVQVDIAGTYNFWNNTIAGCAVGIFTGVSAGNLIFVNTLFTGNAVTGDTANKALAAGTDYNRTSNSSLGYTVTGSGNTHDAVSQTFTFANAAAYNWHLTVDDAGAKNLGVSDPGSGLFSTDVDGETRSGSWDVGFDEYPSATRRRNAVVAWRRP